MIIPRHADGARDVLIARGDLHAGAGGLLADGGAIEFLPRRLVGRVGEAALVLQLGATLLQFIARDQDVGVARVEVDANLVAGLQDRQPAVSSGRFLYDIILMPYHCGTEPLRRWDASAGKCLPGDPTPLLCYGERFSVTGLTFQTFAVAGGILIFP